MSKSNLSYLLWRFFYGVPVNKMWQGCLWKCNKAGFSREKGVARMDGCGYLRLHHQCCCWPNLTSLAKSKRQQHHLAAVIIPKKWSDRLLVLYFPWSRKTLQKLSEADIEKEITHLRSDFNIRLSTLHLFPLKNPPLVITVIFGNSEPSSRWN